MWSVIEGNFCITVLGWGGSTVYDPCSEGPDTPEQAEVRSRCRPLLCIRSQMGDGAEDFGEFSGNRWL